MARNELGTALKGLRIGQMVEERSGISVRTIRNSKSGSKDTKMSTLQTLSNVYGMELGFHHAGEKKHVRWCVVAFVEFSCYPPTIGL